METAKSHRRSAPARGGVKFVLVHHGACRGGSFHYRIGAEGERQAELDESARGQHPRSVGVVIDGDCDVAAPTTAQMDALKKLLLQLKLRYPGIEVGAHRQVRGAAGTTCPGRRFPMTALAKWCRTELLRERDAVLTREFESQYSKI